MAELLGTIASCVQLADCCIKLTASIAEVYERVKGASERLQKHTEQITNLLETARLIERTKLLQNAAVESHLCATLNEARNLQDTLDHVAANYRKGLVRRYWHAMHGVEEKKIVTQLENLEQRKSSLVLCINIVQSDSLAGIECDVSRILRVVSERTEKRTRWSVIATVGHIPPFRNTTTSSVDGLENRGKGGIGDECKQVTPTQYSIDVTKATTETMNSVAQGQTGQSAPAPYHTYQRMKVGGAKVINGNFYGKGGFRSGPRRAGTGNSYDDIETSSSSKVINGDVFNAPDFWK